MKLFTCKLALVFLGLIIILSLCCTEKGREAAKTHDKGTTQKDTEPNVVGKIGDYTITKGELEKRLMREIQPNPYEYGISTEIPDAKSVLMKMIAEKAMVIEARKQNLQEDETMQAVLKQYREKRLANLLLGNHLQGKINITDSEIDEKMKSDPKLDRVRAKAMLAREKGGELVGQFYNELYKKLHVQKQSDNFYKTAQIHQRLLLNPKEPRKAVFIRISQVKNELTPEEKNIVLATYDNGKITLKDWFDALCELSPPSRPRNLHTPQGVELLLERALRMPIFVAEAKSYGFDKDENLLKQVRDYEDNMLLNKARREQIKDIKGPIPDEQIVDYFNKNKKLFGTQDTLKIDQFWCQDIKTAQKAKAELDNGKDFEEVKQSYSLVKKTFPFDTSSSNERIFFKELWDGDPNEVVGPIKGFHSEGIKWRIVKILEKKPATVTEYSADNKRRIESKMLDQQRDTTLKKYRKDLLEKYSYEIYADKIRDIDPLDIP
jgi:hypothetical protein